MADTMIDVINEVLRATQQRPNKTALSDNDDTNFLLDRINDALEDIYTLRPTAREIDGSITVTPSTRTFSVPSGVDPHFIHDWSFRINDADGDILLDVVTKEYIVTRFPLYESEEAEKPQYVYIDAGLIAVFPLLETGASNLTVQFSYTELLTKLTGSSNTFPFQDRSDEMRYVKLSAQLAYEIYKGLGQPAVTLGAKDSAWARIVAKYARLKRQGFIGYRRYGS